MFFNRKFVGRTYFIYLFIHHSILSFLYFVPSFRYFLSIRFLFALIFYFLSLFIYSVFYSLFYFTCLSFLSSISLLQWFYKSFNYSILLAYSYNSLLFLYYFFCWFLLILFQVSRTRCDYLLLARGNFFSSVFSHVYHSCSRVNQHLITRIFSIAAATPLFLNLWDFLLYPQADADHRGYITLTTVHSFFRDLLKHPTVICASKASVCTWVNDKHGDIQG